MDMRKATEVVDKYDEDADRIYPDLNKMAEFVENHPDYKEAIEYIHLNYPGGMYRFNQNRTKETSNGNQR